MAGTKPKRVNKKKDEIAAIVKRTAEIDHQKTLVRLMWPFISNGLTMYEAQTAANATAGFIKARLQEKESELKVKNLSIDLKGAEEGVVKNSMLHILQVIESEDAKNVADLLERLGKTLQLYAANQFMKQPMKKITVDEIVA